MTGSAPTQDSEGAGNGWLGNEFEITVDRFGHGGIGVGRRDGRVVFIRHALPGETLRVVVTEDRGKGYCRAEIREILQASPHRIDAVCPVGAPVFAGGAGAGCCDLSHTTGAHARELKSQVLTELLGRMGGIEWDGEVVSLDPDATAASETGWRVRERLFIDAQGRPGVRGYQSHSVLPRLDCAQPVAGMVDGLDEFGDLEPGSELMLTVGDDGRRHIVHIAAAAEPHRGGRGKRPHSGRRRTQQQRAQRSTPRREVLLAGEQTVRRTVGGRTWEVPVTGFWQAHRFAASGYSDTVRTLLRSADLPRSMVAWDLYGGAGVLAGAVLDENDESWGTARVHIVEADRGATAAADLTFADDHRVHVHHASVMAAVADLPSPDVVIVDPPRSGAGREVVERITAAEPSAVIAVGCDPATFARDLADYRRGGYEVDTLLGFDAFPLTHHLEAVALLRPGAPAAS
ncbi:UNVERIFIED_CONTAM: tRNA/tmRNA/rRNA uracil-C5-methylase (TrmA/RlmC/RlmD family) [Williamsia faeni]